MRASTIRHNFLVAIATVGLTVFFVTSAHAGVAVEFENWATQFSPNPMVCNTGMGCTVMQTQTNILPHTHPGFTVDRTATIDVNSGPSGELAQAQTYPSGDSHCGVPNGMGCLMFTTGESTYASLTLQYDFSSQQLIDNIGFEIANPGSHPFVVDAFYWNGSTFMFGDEYSVAAMSGEHEYTFDFPTGTMTEKVEIVYNPLLGHEGHQPQQPDIEAELCCGATNVPEPGSLVLFGSGVLGVAGLFRHKLNL